MNGIIRVFPKSNSYTPTDEYAFFGAPPLDEFIPEHNEIHVSCSFTWDKAICEELAFQWEFRTNKPVKLGGPAYGSQAENFLQGMYIKSNIIFTTRGCNNNCPWCIVPKIEGKLRELPIYQGNIIQDNNFLQSNREHKDKVFNMLRTQKGICFKGGLEPDLINDHFIDALQSFYYTKKNGTKVSRISELWLACDTDAMLHKFKIAVEKLKKAGFNREKIKCYALIGDSMKKTKPGCKKYITLGQCHLRSYTVIFQIQKLNTTPNGINLCACGHGLRQQGRIWKKVLIIKIFKHNY